MKILLSLMLLFITTFSFAKTIEIGPSDSLQEAINNAKSGDTILLKPGTYESKTAFNIEGKENLTITGDAENSEGDVWIIVDDVNESVINISKKSKSIFIRDIKARHKKPLKEYACNGAVIRINDSTGVKIMGCELNGCGAMGVEMADAKKIFISGCYIHKNSWTAFYIYNSSNIKITYNKIENNKSFIDLNKVSQFEMWGNQIKNNEGYYSEKE